MTPADLTPADITPADNTPAQITPTDAALHVLAEVGDAVGEVVGVPQHIAGTAPGLRLRLHVAGHGEVFLKAGDGSPEAARAVAEEVALLQQLTHRCLPQVIAGDPLGPVPWMVQIACDEEGWTPPWPARMSPVWRAIRQLRALPPPPWLGRADDLDPWASDVPEGLVSPRARHRLQEAASRVSLSGGHLVHGDLGGGNVHVAGRRVTVVDWSDAFIGAGEVDLLSIAVDVACSDGRRLEPPVADLPAWMAKTAGLLASAAARPPWPGPGGAEVRRQQLGLATTAVSWACDLLDDDT